MGMVKSLYVKYCLERYMESFVGITIIMGLSYLFIPFTIAFCVVMFELAGLAYNIGAASNLKKLKVKKISELMEG